MKKIFVMVVIICMIFLTGCGKDSQATLFKKSYEAINGEVNSSGKEHRTVTIAKDNPFVKVEASEIVKMIQEEKTFYVYFGSKLCPWCRSVIEKAIDVAKDYGVKKIYYVDIWDEEGNEILRDKYKVLENGEVELVNEGTEDYFKLLEYFDNVLENYTGVEGEKRIYAPNYIYVSEGKAIRMTTGISDKQTDSREELTDEILDDEEKLFSEFFADVCDETC